MRLPLSQIHAHQACQSRTGLVPGLVAEYSELYRRDDCPLPPLEVFQVARRWNLVDGFHRLQAAVEAGSGTIDDCIWRAVSANQTHGLRRGNQDKRRAVTLALLNPIGQEQSSRTIAEHIGVSVDLVSRVRKEVEGALSENDNAPTEMEESSKPPTVQTKDGRRYPKFRPKKAEPPTQSADRVRRARMLVSQKVQQLRCELRRLWPSELKDVGDEVDRYLERAWARCQEGP